MVSVVHICTDFWPSTGGIERFVRDLATRSVSIGMRVTVLCFNRIKGFSSKLPPTEIIDDVLIRRVPFLDLKYYKPVAIPLSVLKSHDLIHVHGIGAPLDWVVMTRWIHKRPIVVSTHGGIFHTSALSGIKRIYFHGFMRLIFPQVDVVAASSGSDATLFSTVAERVTLLENAVEIQPYLALSVDRKVQGRCLYVGRLSDNKGIHFLLRAASVAKQQGAVFSIRLVGPDVEGRRSRYEALTRNLGLSDCVVFVGEIEQHALLQEYELADIFISASQYEGFGLAAIEAKASGCRLLLHANDAFCHAFKSDAAATIVDFTDVQHAGTALANLVSSPRDASLLKTRRAVEAYSWERKIGEWSLLYSSVKQVAAEPPKST